jgi:hypothetical protein
MGCLCNGAELLTNLWPSARSDCVYYVDCMMAHAQKPVFVQLPNGQVHVFQRGMSVQSAVGSQAVCISLQNVPVL